MKKLLTAIITVGIVAFSASPSWSADTAIITDDGGVESLRGYERISDTNQAELLKHIQKDREPIDRSYVHQPPLIPHDIRGYDVTLNANKCLSCHSWKNAGKVGATKISPTHFVTRDNITLSDVSPRRYFCLQCHVPQADAKPLVENNFEPVESLQ
ncbi:nitrate reductase cytochrome c-type subunit [Psychromonas sp. MME2]|uniref:nitrate reductase cytochrome c-type subunit n=1 Tax=unclassified Psychromonas TaxID=2614957 RepID=UPI00339BFB22